MKRIYNSMIPISISKHLKTLWQDTVVGYVVYNAEVTQHNPELWKEIDLLCKEIEDSTSIEDIAKLPHIHDTREAYKSCGKKPSRYRVSSEALLRRIIQGKGLYQVNTIVDINNYISLKSHFSLGSFNLEKVEPPIVFDIGNPGETYEGIGKGIINIENLPVFRDQLGAFGSPTSDSERAKVTLDAKKFLTVVISFSGIDDVQVTLNQLTSSLKVKANAEIDDSGIIFFSFRVG
jgi:DNA/RNA-binding domain of Phe-tRNA-synthetase-like protein